MDPAISKALDAICAERDDAVYSASFAAVAELLAAYGESGLADRLFSEIPRTVPFEIVAELLDFLLWQTRDNGGAIVLALEEWLREGSDNRKLLIALHMGVYPFTDSQEMRRVLSDLVEKKNMNILVAVRCKELIQSRDTLEAAASPPRT